MMPVFVSPDTFVIMALGWSGKLSTDNILSISSLLKISIVTLPFQAITIMSIAAFNARKETNLSMKISLIGFIFLLPSCWWFGKYYGVLGIVSAILLCSILISMVFLWLLYKRYPNIFTSTFFLVPVMVSISSLSVSSGVIFFKLSLNARFIMLITSMVLFLVFFVWQTKLVDIKLTRLFRKAKEITA